MISSGECGATVHFLDQKALMATFLPDSRASKMVEASAVLHTRLTEGQHEPVIRVLWAVAKTSPFEAFCAADMLAEGSRTLPEPAITGLSGIRQALLTQDRRKHPSKQIFDNSDVVDAKPLKLLTANNVPPQVQTGGLVRFASFRSSRFIEIEPARSTSSDNIT